MDTNKKAWRKTWIQAVPRFTSSLQVLSVKEKKNILKLWNSWFHKYTVICTFHVLDKLTAIKARFIMIACVWNQMVN